MAKVNTGSAREIIAANYVVTYKDGGQAGFRIVLRSDRKILKRTRWYSMDGKRVPVRSGAYAIWVGVKEEAYTRAREENGFAALLDRICARRGLHPDSEPITPKPEKAPAREYGSLREKIMAEQREREERYATFARVHADALAAGARAADECVPEPMHVVERANPLDDSSPVVHAYAPVLGGVCGFAWVALMKGNSSFAHWARKNAGFRSSDYHGTHLWITEYGQSMERKAAFARAYAQVLQDNGIGAYAASRMD